MLWVSHSRSVLKNLFKEMYASRHVSLGAEHRRHPKCHDKLNKTVVPTGVWPKHKMIGSKDFSYNSYFNFGYFL